MSAEAAALIRRAERRARLAGLTLTELLEHACDVAADLSEGSGLRFETEAEHLGVRIELRVIKQSKPRTGRKLRAQRDAALRAYDAEVIARRDEVSRLHEELGSVRAELALAQRRET